MSWQIENNSLVKEFEFKDFKELMVFVNKIAELAEGMNHHPDLFIHSYKKLKVTISTHSTGKITDKDYALAKSIDGKTEV